MVQMELLLRQVVRAERVQADAETMLDVLFGVAGPLSAAEVAWRCGWDSKDADRRVRAAANAAGGYIISAPGRGYIHARNITVEQFNREYDRAMRSQIRKMAERRLAMVKAVHAGGKQQ